jgi:hypothetical protein
MLQQAIEHRPSEGSLLVKGAGGEPLGDRRRPRLRCLDQMPDDIRNQLSDDVVDALLAVRQRRRRSSVLVCAQPADKGAGATRAGG